MFDLRRASEFMLRFPARVASPLNLTTSASLLVFKSFVKTACKNENRREPNTYFLLEHLFSEGKTVVTSRSDFNTKQMTHWAVSPDSLWQTNHYGIPEPNEGTLVLPSAIDLVFVPLLGYDVKGQRVGYGHGFYDRFLTKCAQHAVFIGLSYFPPGPKIIDSEPTDIRLNYCIHSEGIFRF